MSDSIFSLNYLALCKSSPDFAAKITKYENAKEYSIQIDEGKETTLLIDGRQLAGQLLEETRCHIVHRLLVEWLQYHGS